MFSSLKGNTAQKQIGPRELISALAAQVKRDYDIEISVEQVLSNAKYRLTVLHELRTLDDQDINTQLDTLMHSYSGQSNDAKTTLAPVASEQGNKLLPLVAMICLTLIVIAALYFFAVKDSGQQLSSQVVPQIVSSEKQEPIQAAQAAPQPARESAKTSKAPLESDTTLNELPALPVKNPDMVFKLHGSNTIGEKLAPALVEAFFKKQGAENFTWVEGNNNVERTVQFIADGKVQAVELHAHGSGTAFKDMLTGVADLGMASRPIKEKELAQSKTALGDLSRVGNEHIIGLDGLAVIVNQNSPLKSMSLNTLAKIFAGEVTNWAQIGQGEGEIKLFARDANSGTWDTFNKLVLKKTGKQLNSSPERFESSSQLSEQVSRHEHAIGFIGLNYIGHNKALAITEGNGATPIFPTKFTVGTEDYALSRRLYLYTPTAASPIVKDFAQFAIGKEGQELVDQVGLISQNIRLQKVYPSQGAPRSYNNYTNRGQRLSLNFRFNQGNGDLDNKGQRDLLRLIDFIEQNPGRRIVLMGFSDSSGAQASNRQLSYRRTKAVEKELVARGIAVMAVEAYGELLPVANNNTNAGRERNRRVEVWVI
ncbi:phosphate ABC transporter substrate-binding/OmpA family protein [Thalassotalea euphylliae]|uniref:Cell envelope biogenesis protein OmpA n=1 Tax=Thalassotalea euphylliae TaxID=1655234 RepID=A0A3E0U438_9GAMM|nr:phosphate ABC transporter substrate-binding/OmpA family protein [Thalassotalea euphylliae]REL30955.1 cell envelope biogenesis protein OmpA [Thalassotalea euphylliae]